MVLGGRLFHLEKEPASQLHVVCTCGLTGSLGSDRLAVGNGQARLMLHFAGGEVGGPTSQGSPKWDNPFNLWNAHPCPKGEANPTAITYTDTEYTRYGFMLWANDDDWRGIGILGNVTCWVPRILYEN